MKTDVLEYICKRDLLGKTTTLTFHVMDSDGNVPLWLVYQSGMEFYYIPVTIDGIARMMIMEKRDFDRYEMDCTNLCWSLTHWGTTLKSLLRSVVRARL